MGMFSAYIFIQTQRNAAIVHLEVFDTIRTQREREKTVRNKIASEMSATELRRQPSLTKPDHSCGPSFGASRFASG